MPEPRNDQNDEDYEILDVTDNQAVNSVVNKVWKELATASPSKQMAIGGASGCVSGLAMAKVSRAVLALVGGSLIVIHFANQQGYINIDWKKIEKSMRKLRQDVDKREAVQPVMAKLMSILRRNVAFTGSFIGGFLIGLSF
ncbi:DgyrCDS5413 [Dimorphilus gyrociliatus]|uniref:DgyrCDS5413 n=1 Tax=Dimorphilus gyrociliatus TaxID=2664684 RepID=A0A7I8VLG5_9ANNE|nr:DgyrCDS5413 [Dimorphilus gyrociliatus]